MAQVAYPHVIGRDLIPELATRVYSSQLDSFREAISNAFDEGSGRVELAISKGRIVIEDWGGGIKSYDEFRKFGQASKRSRTGEVIGEKGLGKLSLLNLGSVVCFETNNGSSGFRFYMTMAGFSRPEFKGSAAFVPHRGTRITISRLANAVDAGDVVPYIRKTFGLRLVRGARIGVNGEAVRPRFVLDPAESLLFTLPRSGAQITGNLKASEDGRGIVDVYIDHVFVTSLEVDTRRKFEGWVNCNALTPETSRNNIVQDAAYKEFVSRLRQHATRFPQRDAAVDYQKLLLSRELGGLLKSYLKDMKIDVRAGNGARASMLKKEKIHEVKGMLEKSLHADHRPKPADRKQGDIVRWEYADRGNEKEPIYFVPPNIVYCNTSNDLYRFATAKSKYYGPTWVRMLPYLARIAVSISADSAKLTPEQFNLKVDQATGYFLRQKKVIG